MVVWGWICPLQREVELEEIDGSPAALRRTVAAGAIFFPPSSNPCNLCRLSSRKNTHFCLLMSPRALAPDETAR